MVIQLVLISILVFFFAYSSGLHDGANVMATIVMTRALSRKQALLMVVICELTAPFLLGTAVATTIGKNIIALPSFDAKAVHLSVIFLMAALIGSISWNFITWSVGIPSSSSHALVGGMVGAAIFTYGRDTILWKGFLYVAASLILSPLVGLIFSFLFLRFVLHLSKDATPRINDFFNRMQIPSSIALAISHGANDIQKPIGLIAMSLLILGISPTFHIPLWAVAGSATATALGTFSGGWRIIKTVGSKIYRLRSVHAFCAQTSSALVILGATLAGGPVSTAHVVSSSILGVGASYRASAVRWGAAQNIIFAWLITIPASGVIAGLTSFLIKTIYSFIG
jgi:PiT family inorganic phosphate transporter